MTAAHSAGPFCALDHRFSIATDDAELTAHLDHVLRHLAVAGDAGHRYELVRDGTLHTVNLDGEPWFTTALPSLALARLLWHVNRAATEASTRLLVVHAGAVAGGDGAILLPAVSGSGKSTLVAGLVRAGLGYLSDEAAGIDPATGLVRPYPRPIALEPGAWPVFAEHAPVAPPAVQPYLAGGWLLDPEDLRPDAVTGAATPERVVLPRYEPGAATALTPIAPADAFMALADSCFNLVDHGLAGVELLASLACGRPAHRLVVGDLDSAVDAVFDLVDAEPRRPPRPGRAPADPAVVPRRRDGIREIELGDEVVVFDESNNHLHRLNPSGTVIWRLLDEASDASDLVALVAAAFRLPEADVADEVHRLVGDLTALGVAVDGRPTATVSDLRR